MSFVGVVGGFGRAGKGSVGVVVGSCGKQGLNSTLSLFSLILAGRRWAGYDYHLIFVSNNP